MTRTYQRWAGNPKGCPENTNNCIAEVSGRYIFRQCSRKRGHGPHGLFCRQHASVDERKLQQWVDGG